MSRRTWIVALCLVGGLGLGMLPFLTNTSSVNGQVVRSAVTEDLKLQLKGKLRPRTPQDFAFIDRVALMVERGQLPLRTVRATFNWARRKHLRYRFPHFKRALQIEAAKLGIVVK